MNSTSTEADPLAAATEAFRRARDAEAKAKAKAERARLALAQAHNQTEQQRLALAEAIAAAARLGRRTAEIRRVTGYTRQRVQQICREAGVAEAAE